MGLIYLLINRWSACNNGFALFIPDKSRFMESQELPEGGAGMTGVRGGVTRFVFLVGTLMIMPVSHMYSLSSPDREISYIRPQGDGQCVWSGKNTGCCLLKTSACSFFLP